MGDFLRGKDVDLFRPGNVQEGADGIRLPWPAGS